MGRVGSVERVGQGDWEKRHHCHSEQRQLGSRPLHTVKGTAETPCRPSWSVWGPMHSKLAQLQVDPAESKVAGNSSGKHLIV